MSLLTSSTGVSVKKVVWTIICASIIPSLKLIAKSSPVQICWRDFIQKWRNYIARRACNNSKKADKGNAVVVQNLTDYQEKVGVMLNTKGKFKKLVRSGKPWNPTICRENKLWEYLNSMIKKFDRVVDNRVKTGQYLGFRD